MTEVELGEVVGVESIVTAATTVSLVVVSVVYEVFLAAERRMDEKAATVVTEVELEGVVVFESVITTAGILTLVEVSVVYEVSPSSRTTYR